MTKTIDTRVRGWRKRGAMIIGGAMVLLLTFLLTPANAVAASAEFWACSTCSDCHRAIYEQHSQSMHANAYNNEVFHAQYTKEVLPLAVKDAARAAQARGCIECHSPISALTNKSGLITDEHVDEEMSGVTCDFCHVMTGHRDDESPGNANYIVKPGKVKYGPLAYESSLTWHHAYSRYHTESAFCGVCHNQENRHGVEIKATYTEWQQSRYAKEGIECQDCHMSVHGFLTGGKPAYEEGQAASTSLATARHRTRLYTHRFPGAHSKSQVVGALTLGIKVADKDYAPGDDVVVTIAVDNSRTGHKMPSGSADLRLMWLEMKAFDIRKETMTAVPIAQSGFLKPFKTKGGRTLAEGDIPEGSRVYRAVFHDRSGKPTLSSYNAVKVALDTRLQAGEVRNETFRITLPEGIGTSLWLSAELNYMPYPTVFARKLGLDTPEVIPIASAKQTINIVDKQ